VDFPGYNSVLLMAHAYNIVTRIDDIIHTIQVEFVFKFIVPPHTT